MELRVDRDARPQDQSDAQPAACQRGEPPAEAGSAGRERAAVRDAREAPSGFEPLYEALQASA
jgi:hypothetical protein